MRNWRYVKICKPVREVILEDAEVTDLFTKLATWETNHPVTPLPPGQGLPAAYTYFGQLIDHDLTFLRQTDGGTDLPVLNPDLLWQARRPALDLDTIYGAGIDDSAVPYDANSGKFILGERLPRSLKKRGEPRDLPRSPKGQPLVADSRNDQHLLISQMQVLWMNFHNKVVDYYANEEGYSGAEKLFELARIEVVKGYQYLVFCDFCPRILHPDIYKEVLEKRNGRLTQPDKYQPTMALEFAAAAFRLHGLIRASYKIMAIGGSHATKTLSALIQSTGKFKGRQFFLTREDIVDWNLFVEGGVNFATPHTINAPPFDLDPTTPPPTVIRERTLRRAHQLGVATAQEVIDHIKRLHPDVAQRVKLQLINLSALHLDPANRALSDMPLWVYLMYEARQPSPDPYRLGILGSWLIADTLLTAKCSTAEEFTRPWEIENSVPFKTLLRQPGGPALLNNGFNLKHLVKFTYAE